MNEKQNTLRRLAGQDDLITSPWCKFGFHKWTVWSTPEVLKDKWGIKGFYQTRECVHCALLKKTQIKGIIE